MYLGPFPFSRDWKYELRVSPSSCLDAVVYRVWNYGAERLRIGGVAEPPNEFYLFVGKLQRFWDVDIGGEEFDARRV